MYISVLVIKTVASGIILIFNLVTQWLLKDLEGLQKSSYFLTTSPKHGSSGSRFINAKTGTIEAKIFVSNMNMDRSFTGIKKGMKELMENNQRAHFQFKKQILINSGKAHDCDLIFVWESLKGCWTFQRRTFKPRTFKP